MIICLIRLGTDSEGKREGAGRTSFLSLFVPGSRANPVRLEVDTKIQKQMSNHTYYRSKEFGETRKAIIRY